MERERVRDIEIETTETEYAGKRKERGRVS